MDERERRKKLGEINDFNQLLLDVQIARVGLFNAREKAKNAAREFERLNKDYLRAESSYKDKYEEFCKIAVKLGFSIKEE